MPEEPENPSWKAAILSRIGRFKVASPDDTDCVFWTSFALGICALLLYWSRKGPGWDGDTLISTTQFIKLVNWDLYGVPDPGAHPKLMLILLAGVVHLLFGAGYLKALTIVAILLNGWMFAVVCRWVYETSGYPAVVLVGLLLNIPWFNIVVTCDNPAFSVPFAIAGLFYYAHRRRPWLGMSLVLVGSLFRPGIELIPLSIAVIEWARGDCEKTYLPFSAFVLGLLHSRFGYLLAYPDMESFLAQCVYWRGVEEVAVLRHSPMAVVHVARSIVTQLIEPGYLPFTLLGLVGMFRVLRRRSTLAFAGLLVLGTYLQVVSVFWYGVDSTAWNKHVEFPIALTILAGMAPSFLLHRRWYGLRQRCRAWRWPAELLVFLAVFGFVAHSGRQDRGRGFDAVPLDIPAYRSAARILDEPVRRPAHGAAPRVLLTPSNYLFFMLELGYDVESVSILDAGDTPPLDDYDVVLAGEWEYLSYRLARDRRFRITAADYLRVGVRVR